MISPMFSLKTKGCHTRHGGFHITSSRARVWKQYGNGSDTRDTTGRASLTAIDPARVARSLRLHVEKLGDGAYRVSGGAGAHVVQHEAGGWQCSCPDSRFNGGVCKHRLATHIQTRLDSRVIAALRSAVGVAP